MTKNITPAMIYEALNAQFHDDCRLVVSSMVEQNTIVHGRVNLEEAAKHLNEQAAEEPDK